MLLNKLWISIFLLTIFAACGNNRQNTRVDAPPILAPVPNQSLLTPYFTPNYLYTGGSNFVFYTNPLGFSSNYSNQLYQSDNYQVVCHSGILSDSDTIKRVLIGPGQSEFETQTENKRYEVKIKRIDKINSTCIEINLYEDVFGPNNIFIKKSSKTLTSQYLATHPDETDRFVGLTDEDSDFTVNCFVKLR